MQEEFVIKDGILLNYQGNDPNIVIPEGVTEIQAGALCLCKTLQQITIPKSVRKIGVSAFPTELSSIIVDRENTSFYTENNSLISRRGSVLLHCCDSAHIPRSIRKIGAWAFSSDDRLVSLDIPHGVKVIGGHAFALCEHLVSVTIPDSVTTIGSWAFACCKSLTELTVPRSVVKLGNMAFIGCDNLSTLTLPKHLYSPQFAFLSDPPSDRIIWY